MPDAGETVDTGRPWPFRVTLEVQPFDPCPRVHLWVDQDAGGLTVDEADTLMVTIGEVRDLASSYRPSESAIV